MEAQIEELTQKNPLAEAEQVKAQASLINATNKSEVEILKASAQKELSEVEMMQKKGFKEADLALEYTKLELEHGLDIKGQGITPDQIGKLSTNEVIGIING